MIEPRGPTIELPDENPHSQLTAILFADGAEYSTAMNKNELATMKAVSEAMDLIASNIGEYAGRTLNFMGDGVIAAFDSATNAIIFALHFQEKISRLGLSVDDRPFGFRIGITIGEIFLEGDRPQGNSVNLAQRIQSLAPVGGTVVSGIVYETVRARSEFEFEYLGAKILKSMDGPTDVYQVTRHDAAVSLKPSSRSGRNYNKWRLGSGRGLKDCEHPSIAVLPLRNLAGDTKGDLFADGVTDDIITNLTRFRDLDVIARWSTFAFRNPTISLSEISRRLQARYVARGSMRHSPDRLIINIELEDVLRNQVVWADQYERGIEDLFKTQSEVAVLAVMAMKIKIEKTELERIKILPTKSLDAYGLVLRGDYHAARYTAVETAMAQRCFQSAIEKDPNYGRARAGKSRTHTHEWRHSWGPNPDRGLQQAAEDAEYAIELDPNDARGHAELGLVSLYSRDHDVAIACYDRALALNPNDANILAEFADVLAHSGRPEDALNYINRAMRLNPIYPDDYVWNLAGAYFKLRAYNEAVNWILRMRNRRQGRRLLAASYAHLGRISDARRIGDEIRQDDPRFSAEIWAKQIVPDKRVEDREQFFHGLKLAGL
jgi:adenylate cyclase